MNMGNSLEPAHSGVCELLVSPPPSGIGVDTGHRCTQLSESDLSGSQVANSYLHFRLYIIS